MINLKQLIQVAPFPENTRTELIEKVDTLPDGKKFELENLCWELISSEYKNRTQIEMQKAILEAAMNDKPLEKDLKNIEDDLFAELVQKLNLRDTEGEIEEVREKLEQISNNTTCPNNTSSD